MSKVLPRWRGVAAIIALAYWLVHYPGIAQYRLFWLGLAVVYGAPMWPKLRQGRAPMGLDTDWNITRATHPIAFWWVTGLFWAPVPMMIAGAIFLPSLKS